MKSVTSFDTFAVYHQCVHQDMCRYQEKYACTEARTLCHELASMSIITAYCYIGLRNAICNMLGFRCTIGPVSNFYATFQSCTCLPSKEAGFATLPSYLWQSLPKFVKAIPAGSRKSSLQNTLYNVTS